MSGNNEVELKGGMYTFMSLKLNSTELDIIDKLLADKVQQAPGFFKDTPVVVDLTSFESLIESGANIDTNKLLEVIRSHRLIPVVASVASKSSSFASTIALPLIEGGAQRQNNTGKDSPQPQEEHANNHDGAAAEAQKAAQEVDLSLTAREVEVVIKAPMLINRPVRSGQQIYARDTDLIVMGQVGPGAEVIADNNIHIYGPLRGRALCGVSGNTSARIFCQSLEAELVSVAGNYRVLEPIPEDLRGKRAQIWLDNDRLNIEPL